MHPSYPTALPSGIGLVAIDLDGTLLNSQKDLPPGAVQTFAAARRAGLRVALLTGRHVCSTVDLARLLRLSGPHGTSGGSLVTGGGGRPVYARQNLSREVTRLVVEVARRRGVAVFLQSARQILVENGEAFLGQQPKHFRRCSLQPCEDILAALRFRPLKAVLYGEDDRLALAAADLEAARAPLHMTSAADSDIEITAPGVNKGWALRQISAVTGVPLQNMMAIGDSPNDLSMLAEAGLAVAVANAHPAVRQVAAVIAPSNDEGGVLWAVEHLALAAAPVF